MIAVCPHNSGIIMNILFPSAYCNIQQIGLILGQQILNRKHRPDIFPLCLPILYLSFLDQTIHAKIADFITKSCDPISIFLYTDCQLSIFRQYRNSISHCLITHILYISVECIYIFSIKFCIHHWKLRCIHGRIHCLFLLHVFSRSKEIHCH